MPQNTFVGPVAEFYDAAEQLNSRPAAVEAAVSFLADLGGNEPVLEFAIGTGRLALPLRERGVAFVIELYIPQLRRMPPGQSSLASDITSHHLNFDTYDFANQRLVSHHFWPAPGGRMTTEESHHRYAWPAELDLMAQLAGLRLRERWGDWTRALFTGESAQHISVWEKPAQR